MTILDKVFGDKAGGDMLFTAGVEVGRVKGRNEFADHLIGAMRTDGPKTTAAFAHFVRAELVKFQREHS